MAAHHAQNDGGPCRAWAERRSASRPADDQDPDRAALLRIMGEGTAAIAAAATCGIDKKRIEQATDTQTQLIRAAAVKMGYPDPETLVRLRDEGLNRIRAGVERQGSSAHCDTAIENFERMSKENPAPK
jgi:hypothetical protein